MIDKRSFWLYGAGRFVSLTGTGIQDIAIPLFILDLTGSAAAMGSFLIVSLVPRLFLYPVAGVIGDRLNRKQIMIWTDFGRGILVLILAFLASQDLVTVPVLMVGQLFISAMDGLFGPSTAAMLADLVEPEELTRANSIMGSVNSTSRIIGPALGGLIYGFGGIMAALIINGVSFISSGLSEIFIRYSQEPGQLGDIGEVVFSMKEGLNFVRSSRGLFVLLIFALLSNFFMAPFFAVHLPYTMRIEVGFSAREFGLVEASFMGGILLGNLAIGAFFSRSRIQKMLNGGLLVETGLIFSLVFVILPRVLARMGYASMMTFGLFLAIYTGFGFFNAFVNTPINTGIQRLAPTSYRARVFSVVQLSTQGIMPLGYGLMGILLDIYPAYIIALGVAVINSAIVLSFVARYSRIVAQDLSEESTSTQEAG